MPHARHSPRPLALIAAVAMVAVACTSDRDPTPAPASPTAPTATAAAAASEGSRAEVGSSLTGGPGTMVVGEPRPAPPLDDLVNADGSAFTLAQVSGDPALVFFGYTHCPDVCPATIGEMFGVFEARPDVQAVFVSVDPERDTAEFLEEWTRYFPENFNAVTGSPGAIRRAADGYGVKYARVETTSTAGYTMSHTADVFLIDESGQLVDAFPFGTSASQIVASLPAAATG